MHIVFLSPVAEFGGAERSMLAWMQATAEAFPGVRRTLVTPGEGAFPEKAREIGVDVKVVPLPAVLAGMGDSSLIASAGSGRGRRLLRLAGFGARATRSLPGLFRYLVRLRRLIRELSPDFVHSNGIKTHLLSRLAGVKSPLSWHLHDFVGHRPLVALPLRWASRRVVAAVAVSEAVAVDARSTLPNVPIRVVYNVVDVERFSPGEARGDMLDQLTGVPIAPPGTVRVALVATYARWKGQDVFIDAASLAKGNDDGLRFRFYIVGGPIYRTGGSQFSRDELKDVAIRHGVAEEVAFLDFQHDPVAVYRAADLVVHASTRPEPFGLTIVEAMACGKPVVISQAGGAAELFVDGENAIGVSPGDASALSRAIVMLGRDSQSRQHLGAKARIHACERFAATALKKQALDLFQSRSTAGESLQ